MRKLIFALTAASAIGFAVPASAQVFFARIGYGPGWGYYVPLAYSDRTSWVSPGFYAYAYAAPVAVYSAPPVTRHYVLREAPVVRRVVRTRPIMRHGAEAYSAYAYSRSYRPMIHHLP